MNITNGNQFHYDLQRLNFDLHYINFTYLEGEAPNF